MKKECAMSIDRENSEKADADTAVSILSWPLARQGCTDGEGCEMLQNNTEQNSGKGLRNCIFDRGTACWHIIC